MTNLYFILAATPDPTPDAPKRERIKMFIEAGEPTHTDSPGDERRAAKDALTIVHGITDRRADDEPEVAGLVVDEPMPAEARPLFAFAVGVSWVRDGSYAAYKGLERTQFKDYYADACAEGMAVYGFIIDALKAAERAARERAGGAKFKPDRLTLFAARTSACEKFNSIANRRKG